MFVGATVGTSVGALVGGAAVLVGATACGDCAGLQAASAAHKSRRIVNRMLGM
jgi:hypothetical protein